MYFDYIVPQEHQHTAETFQSLIVVVQFAQCLTNLQSAVNHPVIEEKADDRIDYDFISAQGN